MTDVKILIYAVIGVFTTIIGVIYWVIKSRDKLIYKDVCKSERKRLEDCIENVLKLTTIQYENLSKNVEDGFKRVEGLIKNARK